MRVGDELHLYTFIYDGGINHSRCLVTFVGERIKPGEIWVKFEPVNPLNRYIGYVKPEDIDSNMATCGRAKTVVLSKPDFGLAKKIAVKHLMNRIVEKIEDVSRMFAHAEKIFESDGCIDN